MGDTGSLARALDGEALCERDPRRARSIYLRSLKLWRKHGSSRGTAITLARLGEVEMRLGRWDAGRQRCEEGMQLLRRIGDRYAVATTLMSTGILAIQEGHAARARGWLEEALTLMRELGVPGGVAQAREHLAQAARTQGGEDPES